MHTTGNTILITGGGSGIGGGLAVAGRRRDVLEKTGFGYVVLDTRVATQLGARAFDVRAGEVFAQLSG